MFFKRNCCIDLWWTRFFRLCHSEYFLNQINLNRNAPFSCLTAFFPPVFIVCVDLFNFSVIFYWRHLHILIMFKINCIHRVFENWSNLVYWIAFVFCNFIYLIYQNSCTYLMVDHFIFPLETNSALKINDHLCVIRMHRF